MTVGKKASRRAEDYFIGLDIGTNSVGWAVTDENYKVLKFNKKRMWGARLFDEAQTAAERRVHRSNRRRLERRNQRLALLQEIFADEMAKVDPTFFLRLEESKFYLEDKDEQIKNKYILFGDQDYSDVEFYEKYPTIYHLRQALMEGREKPDLREVYLAIAHILKNRGHFLFKGAFSDSENSLKEQIIEIGEILNLNLLETEKQDFDAEKVQALSTILLDFDANLSQRKKALQEVLGKKNAFLSAFQLAIGSKVKLKDLFIFDEDFELDKEVEGICFGKVDYDEVRDKFEEVLQEDIDTLDLIKTLYDTIILNQIIPGGKTLSEAKVDSYEKHKSDLQKLKTLLKADPALYREVLREDKDKGSNYVNYIGQSKNGKRCSREDFYKSLKKSLNKLADSSEKEAILAEVERGTFLPLQRIKENGVIPYQIHQQELEKILDSAAQYYPFLNEEVDAWRVRDKIVKLMTFRIPYYVGPLNDYHNPEKDRNGFAWIVKNKNEKITPWNFEEVVNLEASAEKFITRMTSECTYLVGEKVLPKNSLIYSKFVLLNELNNIHCEGKKLTPEIKQQMIADIFKNKHGKVTKKRIRDYLVSQNYYDGKTDITGMDFEIQGDLRSYRDMVQILGEDFDHEMAENIILWSTLFHDSRNLLRKKIEDTYGEQLTKKQVQRLSALVYKDWGRLSKKFLTEIYSSQLVNLNTGECLSILGAMENTENNLMELLSTHFDFSEKVNQLNEGFISPNDTLDYEMIEELQISPAIKRSLWQTLKIVEELKKIMGHPPKKIFIEVVRTNRAEKKRTESRKKRLIELYKNIKDESRNWKEELENTDENYFRRKKLYLYYTQRGRCAYSGEAIDLDLLNTKAYDIDHIYPRSKTKDDSFNNLVLVKSELNREKTDIYPISTDIQGKMREEWKLWLKKGLISEEKYHRLVRTTGFTDEELANFIARQIVQTAQVTKIAANILEQLNPETRLVYVKAENVSDFRHENEFVKVRDLNDHHHAQDAYLNIVVGNVYDEKFTKSPFNFIKKQRDDGKDNRQIYSLKNMFKYELKRNGKVIWHPDKLHTVQQMMGINNIQITKKVIEQKGALYDATIYKAKVAKPGSYFPLKLKDSRLQDVTKYGGYTSIKIAYYKIVRYFIEKGKKGEREEQLRVVPIPIYLEKDAATIEAYLKAYLEDKEKKKEILDLEVLCPKFGINSLIELNGFPYYVGGKTNDNFNIDGAIQVTLKTEPLAYLKKLVKYRDSDYEWEQDLTKEDNFKFYQTLLEKKRLPLFQKKKANRLDVYESVEVQERFKALELKDQAYILLEILNSLTDRKTAYDLKLIKMTSSRNTIGFNLKNLEQFALINLSITGLFENKTVIKERQ